MTFVFLSQAVKSKQATTDGFALFPITEGATEFFIPSSGVKREEHSAFVIAAPLKDTCLEAYIVKGNTYRKIRGLIQLQEYDIFQLESDQFDMTGIYINSTRPIAVFGGHECSEIPVNTRFCDHLVSQVPPLEELGTAFNIGPIDGRGSDAGYIIRVVATQQGTSVTFSTRNNPVTLNRGEWEQETVNDNKLVSTVVCSKPCVVTQYNPSHEVIENDIETDAFMTLIPPVDHYLEKMRFGTGKYYDEGSSRNFRTNFVSIMAPAFALDGVRFDGRVGLM